MHAAQQQLVAVALIDMLDLGSITANEGGERAMECPVTCYIAVHKGLSLSGLVRWQQKEKEGRKTEGRGKEEEGGGAERARGKGKCAALDGDRTRTSYT